MLGTGAGSDHHDGNAARRGALAQLHHELVAGHAGHFEVGDDEMTAVLGDKLGGVQAILGEYYAIAVLLEHAADKFADADGVVGDDNNAFVLDAIDGLGGNSAASHRFRTGSEDARCAGVGLQVAAFARFGGHHAIQIDEENQAAVGSDGRSGKKFYAAKIFTEILDDNFVFADDFFDDESDLAISCIGDNHAKVAVNRLEGRQAKIGVEANDFSDDVAHLGEQLAANVFDFIGAKTANFFDDREWQGEIGATAAHKQRRGNNQGQGNL